MQPTVGRIVHYTNLGDADGKYPPEQQAAIITRVRGDDVWLAVLYATGLFFMEHPVPRADEYTRGHWTWPPRV